MMVSIINLLLVKSIEFMKYTSSAYIVTPVQRLICD